MANDNDNTRDGFDANDADDERDDDLLGEGWCWDDDNPVLSPLLVSR